MPYWGHPRPELARLWYEDGALLWGGTVEDVDGTDGDSLSYAEVECRKQWMSELDFLRKHIPGFGLARVEDSGTSIGVRVTRHIVGEYTYTGQDLLESKEFPDEVAYITPQFLGVPYRCLIPRDVDNLLIASKCISTTPGQTGSSPALGAYNNMKSIPTVMTYGEAAGTAAALCVKMETTPRKLDIQTLQKALKDQGALVDLPTRLQLMDKLKRPDGTSHGESLRKNRENSRQRWEKRGYKFSAER